MTSNWNWIAPINTDHSFQQQILDIAQATPKEFVYDTVPMNGEPLSPVVSTLLDILKKATNPDFQRPRVSQRGDLLFSERFSDVTSVCPDSTAYPAHQVVLSGESPYFNTVFTGPWSEQNQDRQWKSHIKSGVLKTRVIPPMELREYHGWN
jgi:hypothetical protein